MSNFQEDFPSLKNFKFFDGALVVANSQAIKLELSLHCLDKQKVKDAINKGNLFHVPSGRNLIDADELKKELNLE